MTEKKDKPPFRYPAPYPSWSDGDPKTNAIVATVIGVGVFVLIAIIAAAVIY
jgi:hypothetical protein